MNDCSVILEEIDTRMDEHYKTLAKIGEQQRETDKQASETHLFERDIQDNQKCRRMMSELSSIEEKLASQSKSLAGFNQTSIKTKFNQYNDQYDALVGEVLRIL